VALPRHFQELRQCLMIASYQALRQLRRSDASGGRIARREEAPCRHFGPM